jgi:hypothetical protein
MSKDKSRGREAEQVPTTGVTAEWIMKQRTFGFGVADTRAGLPPRADFDCWDGDAQWSYERGRVWGLLAPRNVQVRRAGKVTREALLWFVKLGEDIL